MSVLKADTPMTMWATVGTLYEAEPCGWKGCENMGTEVIGSNDGRERVICDEHAKQWRVGGSN